MLKNILSFLQVLVPLLLIIFVTAQSRGAGLSEVFGGDGAFHSARRGPEKVIFRLTVVFATLFFVVTLLSTYFA